MYRPDFIAKVKSADKKLMAVRLAKECIRHKIPVLSIAEKLQVARPTVYAWFIGKSKPIKSLEVKMQKLLDILVTTNPEQ